MKGVEIERLLNPNRFFLFGHPPPNHKQASRLIGGDAANRHQPPYNLGWLRNEPTPKKGSIIHAHQFQEDVEVFGRIIGRRQQAAEHDSTAQDQRLPPLPIRSKRRKCLSGTRLSLLVSFRREPSDRELYLD